MTARVLLATAALGLLPCLWLGQSEDPRALALFEELLTGS
jgi:hypothetical protein